MAQPVRRLDHLEPARCALASERRIVIIDGPDHGGSPPVRHPFTLDGRAGAAVEVLDHLGIREPVN